MREVRSILILVMSLLFIAGCRSSRSLEKTQQQRGYDTMIQDIVNEPSVQEMTASLSLNYQGVKVNGQIRMRWGHSVQISVSMLGLMEIARVEFLPEMVVVTDRVNNLYSVCHYADIPYRNELGLDFDVVQRLFWNRLFSPGTTNYADIATRVSKDNTQEDGIITLTEMECGYKFVVKGGKLNSVTKQMHSFIFKIDYSDYTKPKSDGWCYPLAWNIEIGSREESKNMSIQLSSLSVEKGTWPDKTQVSRRLKQVTLNELLDNLSL